MIDGWALKVRVIKLMEMVTLINLNGHFISNAYVM